MHTNKDKLHQAYKFYKLAKDQQEAKHKQLSKFYLNLASNIISTI